MTFNVGLYFPVATCQIENANFKYYYAALFKL